MMENGSMEFPMERENYIIQMVPITKDTLRREEPTRRAGLSVHKRGFTKDNYKISKPWGRAFFTIKNSNIDLRECGQEICRTDTEGTSGKIRT